MRRRQTLTDTSKRYNGRDVSDDADADRGPGRPPLEGGEIAARVTVTLPPSLLAELDQALGSNRSAKIAEAVQLWLAHKRVEQSMDEDFDRIMGSDAELPIRCECGKWSHVSCDGEALRSEMVEIDVIPPSDRASHTAAGNRGRYPHNGAMRLLVTDDCADTIMNEDGDWCELVASERS